MTYRLENEFGGAGRAVKAKVREIDDRLAVMVDRLNSREVVDARPAIEGWMAQALNAGEETSVRTAALEATKRAIMHIGYAAHFNRVDSGSAQMRFDDHFAGSLTRRAETLVELLPEPEGLLEPMAVLAHEANDADLRKAACSAYVAVRNHFVNMTGYRDAPERAVTMHMLQTDITAPDFSAAR